MISLRKAVDMKCKDCIYDSAVSGSWRQQAENCTSEHTCPLWPHRPVTTETVFARRKSKSDTDSDLDSEYDT